jgi:hypothetical protein
LQPGLIHGGNRNGGAGAIFWYDDFQFREPEAAFPSSMRMNAIFGEAPFFMLMPSFETKRDFNAFLSCFVRNYSIGTWS